MKNSVALLALFVTLPAAGYGQTVAQDVIRGQQAYEQSNYELARQIFSTIVASKQQVRTEDKVTAYKYLGGYWALQNTPKAQDSASSYFIAALDYDAFTDLDLARFAVDEQNAFSRAKRSIFKVGIKPIAPKALNPLADSTGGRVYIFKIVSTHSARLSPELVKLSDPTKKETFPAINNTDGVVRDVVWDGLINTVRADTGIYEFRVTAIDNLPPTQTVIETQKFRIEHVHAPLEETLPEFGAADTLVSMHPGSVPIKDGLKGVLVGALAAALPSIALSQRAYMSGWSSHRGIGIMLGVSSGAIAGWYGTNHRADRQAVAENVRRRQLRAQFNAGVIARNRARIDKTILVIRPLSNASVGG